MEQSEQKTTKNKVIQGISFVITFVIAYFGVQYLFSNASLEDQLIDAAQELNEVTPKKIDQDTRLDSASTVSDKIFKYHYTLVNLEKSEVNLNDLNNYMKTNLTESVKNTPELKQFRDNKVTMSYNYYDKNGVFITSINITPAMYQN
ncbi:hypothetical protein [Zunongwangia sp.]|uniref:hypothetical protein n=1 Tax=Zunongwangia sp. TaxID=1965325 RepID=UPI003AA8902E